MIQDLQWVFWGMTAETLFLAAGRYTVLVAATLLAVKHLVWFARLRSRRERRRLRFARAVIEFVAASSMAALYAQSIYLDGPAARFATAESLVQVWVLAILFVGLVVLSRSDTPPP